MKRWIVIGAVGMVALWVVSAFLVYREKREVRSVTGVVLRYDTDARKQIPLGGVDVLATGGWEGRARTQVSGLFRLDLTRPVLIGEKMMLSFHHHDYQPYVLSGPAQRHLLVVRMVPAHGGVVDAGTKNPEVRLTDVRVRYSSKNAGALNVGSAVRTFEVVSTGNVPCDGSNTCSPDGRWKARVATATLDAGDGNEFRNARLSCIAGPCPFTSVQSENLAHPGRTINVAVRNWSDMATFLIEAEVVHTQVTDLIRESYPAIFGAAMSFTLPATARGPSIVADLNGQEIVFPLGPALRLSWATCEMQHDPERNQLYRCELKPGYTFR